MKKLIQKFLAIFNLKLTKFHGRNFDEVLLNIMKKIYSKDSKLIFFDIGAHRGESIKRFIRLAGKSPYAIFSFEAAKPLYEELIKKFPPPTAVTPSKSTINIFNNVVGASNGNLEFNFHPTATGSSSALKHLDNTFFSTRRNLDGNLIKLRVDSISLDNFYIENNITHNISLLKIDVQGYEDDVFKGIKNLINNQVIDIIEVEVIAADVYERRTSFYTTEKYLEPAGYRLVALLPDGRHTFSPFDIIQNPELQFDVIYVSNKVFEKITH